MRDESVEPHSTYIIIQYDATLSRHGKNRSMTVVEKALFLFLSQTKNRHYRHGVLRSRHVIRLHGSVSVWQRTVVYRKKETCTPLLAFMPEEKLGWQNVSDVSSISTYSRVMCEVQRLALSHFRERNADSSDVR